MVLVIEYKILLLCCVSCPGLLLCLKMRTVRFERASSEMWKIVGHSLGGGTVALLTYVLREWRELSTTTCVTFAPGLFFLFSDCGIVFLLHYILGIANWMSCAAACMTWELAEPGNDFITSVINGADLVVTFFAASVDVAC
ncbi:hypothetical protein Pint_35867 [Pistacia integerrima]|uniref:Uncharacterized protein n=1 Tax=Pistacia integerrima TaxID=434235 RepID=A0ACC0Y0W6_9ROSI|nr:hypothetical protein Pint_35867 [Pistacia integerrima]